METCDLLRKRVINRQKKCCAEFLFSLGKPLSDPRGLRGSQESHGSHSSTSESKSKTNIQFPFDNYR